MRYFCLVSYLGTGFSGYQLQPDLRTVQGELTSAVREVLGADATVTASSRTDAGVHANALAVVCDAPSSRLPAEKLPIALIPFLPEDISLFFAKECSDDFHPRYDCRSKEYLYRILNTKIPSPFLQGRVWHYPRLIDDEGLMRMRECAREFLGSHDFRAFMSSGSDACDFVREIRYLDIERSGDEIIIKICADGFLYNMVRIIVGTLVECAHGRFSPSDISEIIASQKRSLAGRTAPAEGLYLNRVDY
ncbi:MAG: tRNA pseudouridine(38-40) synthase TruA [Clostridia bacterium]|nr:tRNA pseudouridine(38-40) synthase TruA [Clostridia bacterium]MBQ8289832.1 tRNA pseudouridine(38-40) synthase TruA [Clostridia bacterium]